MCTRQHYNLTQPRYNFKGFPCVIDMNRASAVCTSVCRARTLQRAVATMKKKTRFNFSFLGFCCAVCCCCFVSITPSSKLGTLRQPWCNSSSISRYSLYGSHERYFCACACQCVFVCHPGPNLDDCNPHIHRISKAPVQYTDIPTATIQRTANFT